MKIVIAGYGIEGKSNYRYFRQKFPEAEIIIADQNTVPDAPSGVKVISGPDVFENLTDADLVVRTASLPPTAIKTNGQITSSTNQFFENCPAPIIGVTGTKGKGTTCSLIASILEAAGKKAYLLGNIGVPALDILDQIQPDDIVVYELSSFQLWDLKKSPAIAVVLMIESDHLEVHADFDDYLSAKANIGRYQTDDQVMVFDKDNQFSRLVADQSPAKKIEYPFEIGDLADSLKLPGQHNRENASAAISVARQFAIDDQTISRGLEQFTGLPHRLKFVREVGGVKYYDDSISTTPGSAVAALESFQQPKILLVGGHDKGGDYSSLAEVASRDDQLKNLIVYGQNAPKIIAALESTDFDKSKIIHLTDVDMKSIVTTASQQASPGDVVILSPAAASFDMFTSYVDRGQQFVDAVNRL
ncbi:UDP-N-acetylmuramoyl-L-alanine--D-glutamate ligase [Candidatus Saccharibacteria bacterium]|nr:MAG: UDP-N-acetylmuramoyl-L-alanine--D-glutamate ligase [Candidatus Saccharibacteria bacterium]